MADEAQIVFELRDGTKVESTFSAPYPLREQLDFEEHFRTSFGAMEIATSEMSDAYSVGRTPDPDRMPRIQWILWFGWHRARPKVASNFKAFLEQLDDYEMVTPEVEEAEKPTVSAGHEAADAVDPTGPEDRSDQGR
jgi:hypothetical protein